MFSRQEAETEPHAFQLRLAGLGAFVAKRLDGLPARSLEALSMQQCTRSLRLAFATVGHLAGVTVIGTLRSSNNDRFSVKAGSAVGAPLALIPPFAAFAPGEVSSTMVPSESTLPLPTTTVGQSVPPHSNEFSSAPQQVRTSALMPLKGAASLPADVVLGAGKAVPGHASKPQTVTTSPSTEPLQRPESEVSQTRAAELLARGDTLVIGACALLSRKPIEDAVPLGTEPRAIAAAHAEPLPTPVQPKETTVPSMAATAYDARPAAEPAAVPIMHIKSLAAPVQSAEAVVPSTAAASAAQSAAKPQRPPFGVSPVAALLAHSDASIAFGDVAAARLFYLRAATLDSARAATVTGKTYDPGFLQAVGAIGVVADFDAAVAWHRKEPALGDEYAAPLPGGLDIEASQ